jgi:hypothetical protein
MPRATRGAAGAAGRWVAAAPLLLLLLLCCAAAAAEWRDDELIVHVVFSSHLARARALPLMRRRPPLFCRGAVRPSLSRAHCRRRRHRRQDVGFDGRGQLGTDARAIELAFHEHYPRAAALAAALAADGRGDRYVFLTHAWLVSLYLDCPPGLGVRCPTPDESAAFVASVARCAAVSRAACPACPLARPRQRTDAPSSAHPHPLLEPRSGDITWHALPHNAHTEAYGDPSLLAAAVGIAHALDARFGLPPKTAASQRDVPGLTRAALPALAAAGVTAISVGVNPASAPPAVPKNTPFAWVDGASGAAVMAFWHPGGYSGTVGDLPMDGRGDCVRTPLSRCALDCARARALPASACVHAALILRRSPAEAPGILCKRPAHHHQARAVHLLALRQLRAAGGRGRGAADVRRVALRLPRRARARL